MKRIYGNEKTNLTLTEKAYQIYSNTDPLRIIEEEYEDEDGEKKISLLYCSILRR